MRTEKEIREMIKTKENLIKYVKKESNLERRKNPFYDQESDNRFNYDIRREINVLKWVLKEKDVEI